MADGKTLDSAITAILTVMDILNSDDFNQKRLIKKDLDHLHIETERRSLNRIFDAPSAIGILHARYRKRVLELEESNNPYDLEKENLCIPMAQLSPIIEAWDRYMRSDNALSFGHAFGVEGRGQGAHNYRRKIRAKIKEQNLALAIYLTIHACRLSSISETQESVMLGFSEASGVPFDTIRRIFRKNFAEIEGALKLGQPRKGRVGSSRGDDPDRP